MKTWKSWSAIGLAAVALAACSSDDPNTTNDTTNDSASDVASEVVSDDTSTESSAASSQAGDTGTAATDLITMEDALDAFWKEHPDAQIKKVELDDRISRWQNGWTYEITGVLDGREYVLEIDATNGEILESEDETADADDLFLDLNKVISPTEAEEAARKEVAADAKLEGWSLDMEDEPMRPEYEVEFSGSDDKEILIHAETGEILDVDN